MKMRIEARGLKDVLKRLGKYENAAQKILLTTGNDLRSRVPGRVATDVRTVYGIKKADIMPAKKGDKVRRAGKIRVSGSTVSNVSFVYTGHRLSVARFQMKPAAPIVKGVPVKQRKPVSVKIKKQRKTIDGVFVGYTGARPEPGQKKMNYIAFRRKTKKRYPIEPVRTLSLPQMVDNPNVNELIREDINDMIVKRLNHNIKRFLGDR